MQFDRKDLSDEDLKMFHRTLLLPRLIEEKMLLLLRQGRISKWFSGIGQEAISVGAALALDSDEWMMPLHRNLGVFTTRGMPLHKLIRQWQGSQEGYSKGRERSFHFGSGEHHICGMISHLGPQLAIADGVALSHKLRNEKKVAVAFTGEGGTSEGDFHEALNVAAVWDLPVIFIIENNGYALSTPSSEQYRCGSLTEKARGYGMDAVKIDGNNLLTVYDTIKGVRKYCIDNQKPFLIECATFRMRGHEEASGVKYVPEHLFEIWQMKDPVARFEEFILSAGVVTESEVIAIRGELKEHIEEEMRIGFDTPKVKPEPGIELAAIYKRAGGVKQSSETNSKNENSSNSQSSEIGPSNENLSNSQSSEIASSNESSSASQWSEIASSNESSSANQWSETGSPNENSSASQSSRIGSAKDYSSNTETGVEQTSANQHRDLRFVDAISEGLRQSLDMHSELVIMGQDIAEYGGVFKITEGFLEKYGASRIRNTPLCESAIIGASLGLSLTGIKSVVEMQFADFVSVGFNQIVNNLAKIHYRWGQHADVVIRMPCGAGVGAGPFHSQSNEAWFVHTPGLKVVYPSTPYDAKGLLIAAINDPNPVMFFEHKALYRSAHGQVPEAYYEVEIGKAKVIEEGDDISIITYGAGVHWAMDYALENQHISIDILDLRTLLPLDYSAISASVARTGKVIVLHEDTLTGGLGGEIAAWIGEHCFNLLDAPVLRCASLDTPVPFSIELENSFLAKSRLAEYVDRLLEY